VDIIDVATHSLPAVIVNSLFRCELRRVRQIAKLDRIVDCAKHRLLHASMHTTSHTSYSPLPVADRPTGDVGALGSPASLVGGDMSGV
jgi:hypothetical protein